MRQRRMRPGHKTCAPGARMWQPMNLTSWEVPVHFVAIKMLWIKLAAPVEHVVMFGVIGISQSVQEIIIAEDSPTILRRAGTLTLDAPRVLHVGVGLEGLFDCDCVLPTITKIVRILETRDAFVCYLAERNLTGISRVVLIPRIQAIIEHLNIIRFALNLESR